MFTHLCNYVQYVDSASDDKMDDMVLSLEQLDGLFAGERRKRSLLDFSYYKTSKWTLPIQYMLDGSHSKSTVSVHHVGL